MRKLRTVEVSQVENPGDFNAEISVDVLSSEITTESTAEIRIELKWLGGKTDLYYGNWVPMELPKRCDEPDGGLVLLPNNHSFERSDNELECWKPNLASDNDFGHPLGLQTIEVDKGKTLSCRAEVWGDHRSSRCLTPDNYVFKETISKGEKEFEKWRFDLVIKSVANS